MESSGFEEQIFGEFSGPLSPMGAKAVHHHTNNGHSIQVMLGMSSAEACAATQRLPDVHQLLPQGKSSLSDHYKTLDTYEKLSEQYGQANGKLEPCYSDEYSPTSSKVIEYVNGKGDYSPTRLEYADGTAVSVFHQPTMHSPGVVSRKKDSNNDGSSASPNATSTSDASSTTGGTKKSEKSKKSDAAGGKKKKTR